MNKVAVFMSGQLRSWDVCKNNLYNNIVDKYDARIYGAFANDEDTIKLTEDDRKRFRCLALVNIDVCPFEEVQKAEETIVRKFYAQLELMNCLHLMCQDSCDVIVWCRPDTIIAEDGQLEDLYNVATDKIYIPNHDNHRGGLNDRFAFGGKDVMLKYVSRINGLKSYLDSGRLMHPETYLREYLSDNKIHVVRSGVFTNTIRKDGTVICAHID